jgi:hypothetical protein
MDRAPLSQGNSLNSSSFILNSQSVHHWHVDVKKIKSGSFLLCAIVSMPVHHASMHSIGRVDFLYGITEIKTVVHVILYDH